MKAAFKALKKDGVVIFPATPNIVSILYRLKGNLFFLDSKLNFHIPGKKNLCNALENFGFKLLTTEYPYWNTPYRYFPKDIFMFLLNIFTNRFYKYAFLWEFNVTCMQKIMKFYSYKLIFDSTCINYSRY